MDLLVYDDDDRRYVPWPVVLVGALAAVLLAVLASAGTYVAAQGAEPAGQATPVGGLSSPEAGAAPSVDPVVPVEPVEPAASAPAEQPPLEQPTAEPAAPSCPDALAAADTALARAGRLEQALTEHTRVMEDLLAERLSPDQALEQTLPVLSDGATDRRRFAEELAAYQAARDACPA